MIPLSHPRVFYAVIVPAAMILAFAWIAHRSLASREASLDARIGRLHDELTRRGIATDPVSLDERTRDLARETDELRALSGRGLTLARDPLVASHATRPFQLIEFEQERTAAARAAQAAATQAGVKIDALAFDVLADTTESPAQPRRRWAQLALARLVVDRAIDARVATLEMLPVPAVRELRLDTGAPVLAEEILVSVRVTGPGARVQAFLEHLILADPANPLLLEHFILRKEGTASTDLASATVVVAGLLPPQNAPQP